MDKRVKQLSGANMDIDLTSDASDIHWKQTVCPWNEEENTKEHKCAVKNTSICKYFCGIKYICHDYTGTLKAQEEEVTELKFFAPDKLPSEMKSVSIEWVRKVSEYLKQNG